MAEQKDELYNEFEEMDKELEEYAAKNVKDSIASPASSAKQIEQEIFEEDVANFFQNVGNKIRGERKYRKMSQSELSRITGVSRPTIINIECGKNGNIVNLFKILMALEVDIKFGWWCE